MDAAEALFAEHGFSGVSFRQICVAAGARNNFAIQYHFGDLERLASAIVTRRTMQFEVQRGEHLARIALGGHLTVRGIIEILNKPIIELRDINNGPIGAKFIVALQNTSWGWKPLGEQFEASLVTQQLIESLECLLPKIPRAVLWQRLYLASLMIMNCAAQIPQQASDRTYIAIIDNVFSMAAAAVEAPLDAESADAMTKMYE